VCISVFLTSSIHSIAGRNGFPPCQNTVGFWNQITLLFLYYVSSRLVTLLKVTDAHKLVTNVSYITVRCKFLNFTFWIFLLFLPEMSAMFVTLGKYKTMHKPVVSILIVMFSAERNAVCIKNKNLNPNREYEREIQQSY
jgi:uncharacterized membrane protein